MAVEVQLLPDSYVKVGYPNKVNSSLILFAQQCVPTVICNTLQSLVRPDVTFCILMARDWPVSEFDNNLCLLWESLVLLTHSTTLSSTLLGPLDEYTMSLL